jgi:hypothetical protein
MALPLLPSAWRIRESRTVTDGACSVSLLVTSRRHRDQSIKAIQALLGHNTPSWLRRNIDLTEKHPFNPTSIDEETEITPSARYRSPTESDKFVMVASRPVAPTLSCRPRLREW